MAQDDGVNIKFGAETDEAKSKIEGLGETIKTAMSGAGGAFSGLTALTVAAGTALEHFGEKVLDQLKERLEKAVEEFAKLGGEIEHMQNRLGGSAEEISALKVALDAVGISTGTFESIARRLPMILQQHAKDFKAAGVAYTDSEGKLLPVTKTIMNLNDHLAKFEKGSARNTEAFKLMGRSGQQMADMVKLTSEEMERATGVAQQFGMILSEKDVEAAHKFEIQTNLLKTAFTGFYVEVGRKLTPMLTDLAEFLRNVLVPVFDLFSTTVGAFGEIFSSVWDVIKDFGNFLLAIFKTMGDEINDVFGSGGEIGRAHV